MTVFLEQGVHQSIWGESSQQDVEQLGPQHGPRFCEKGARAMTCEAIVRLPQLEQQFDLPAGAGQHDDFLPRQLLDREVRDEQRAATSPAVPSVWPRPCDRVGRRSRGLSVVVDWRPLRERGSRPVGREDVRWLPTAPADRSRSGRLAWRGIG